MMDSDEAPISQAVIRLLASLQEITPLMLERGSQAFYRCSVRLQQTAHGPKRTSWPLSEAGVLSVIYRAMLQARLEELDEKAQSLAATLPA
jgi:hypothetical protein